MAQGPDGPNDSVLILSANAIEHALVMLGCLHGRRARGADQPGLFSLISSDHAKLKHAYATVQSEGGVRPG